MEHGRALYGLTPAAATDIIGLTQANAVSRQTHGDALINGNRLWSGGTVCGMPGYALTGPSPGQGIRTTQSFTNPP